MKRFALALAALLLQTSVIPLVEAAGTVSVIPANTVLCNPGPSAAAPSACSSLPSGMTVPPGTLPTPTPTTLGGVNSKTATSHQFLTQVGTDGSISSAQPAASDVSGLAASATTDTTNASNINSGTLSATQLPNPSSTTLGGVKSKAAVTHQFLTQIGTDGSVSQAQPAASDVSGLAASATTDATNASNINTGTLADGELSPNVPLLNAASNTFTGAQTAGSYNVTGSTVPANGMYLSGTSAPCVSSATTQATCWDSARRLKELSGHIVAIRTITSGTVSVTTTDSHICVNKTSGSATAVTLGSLTSGQIIVIDDCKGDAATNNITITPTSGNIDGSANFVINTNWGSWTGMYTGSIWKTESAR